MELKQLKTIVVSFILILLVLIPSPLFVGGTVKAAIATISSPYPANQSVDVELTPTLNITINDADGHDMNITWYSNSSGSWEVFGTGGLFATANYSYDFEDASDLNNWTTTGIRYDSATYAHSGTWSLEIEGAAEYACHNLSLANYSKVNISWWICPWSVSVGDDIDLRFYNGTSWATVRNVDGDAIEYKKTHYYDVLTTNDYVFNDDCKICWNVSAGDTTDRFYLDDVNITYGYTGSMPNGTYAITNFNFSNYSTTYYWNVSVNDGTDTNNSNVFYFTTLPNPTVPTITINFAGNLSDSGGPYWRPPGETVQLTGTWSDGYYTNDSRQQEGWMYINLSVSDGNGVPNVWLQWKNESTWTNYTYPFLNTSGGYFEFNTSGNISTAEGYNYSFDIVANNTLGNSKTVWWNKSTVWNTNITRRIVQLNCATVNISYTPYYYINHTETYFATEDTQRKDIFHHDQGTAGPSADTGYLISNVPGETVENNWCSGFTGNWFDESQSVESFTLINVYYHLWWSVGDPEMQKIGWHKNRDIMNADFTEFFVARKNASRSNLTYDGPTTHDTYYLTTHLLDITDTSFTDNDIYEFSVKTYNSGGIDDPSTISNRSFTSFVLLNVPDNATLNATGDGDTDGDGLKDWTELYVNYTNPFLADTDNDGVSDYDETLSGSDPNNYTDTTEYTGAVGYPDGYYYFETEAPHQYSLAVAYDETWHYYQMS